MSRAGFARFVVLFCCGILEMIVMLRCWLKKALAIKLPQLNANGSFKEKIALTRAAESLSERIARSKEYEVISETEKAKEQPANRRLRVGFGAANTMRH